MKDFSVTRRIDAPPERVWAILTDASRYPEWEPGMERIDGQIVDGGDITLHVKYSKRPFPLQVGAWDAPRGMTWSSGMPLGLFRGERRFTLAPNADGTTTFTMREQFTGLLSPLIGRAIPDLQPMFEQFADGLAAAAAQ
ncbi:MAG: SRPBCC domain-containing protein [Myxococcota bacterium]